MTLRNFRREIFDANNTSESNIQPRRHYLRFQSQCSISDSVCDSQLNMDIIKIFFSLGARPGGKDTVATRLSIKRGKLKFNSIREANLAFTSQNSCWLSWLLRFRIKMIEYGDVKQARFPPGHCDAFYVFDSYTSA